MYMFKMYYAAKFSLIGCLITQVSKTHPSSLCISGEDFSAFPSTTFLYVQEHFPQDTSSSVNKESLAIENSICMCIFQSLKATVHPPHALNN